MSELPARPRHPSRVGPPVVIPMHELLAKDGLIVPAPSPAGFTTYNYRYLSLYTDGLEDVEAYEPGGFAPISLGDKLLEGRYVVLQKLGHGGSSTVWLARDHGDEQPKLVTLKVLRADISNMDVSKVPDIAIIGHLQSLYPSSNHFQTILHHFFEKSPNGTHLFIIYPLAGPNVASLYTLPTNNYWETKPVGCRRFRGDLAKQVARDTATGLHQMHAAGNVHGDLTSSNILVKIAPHVIQWSDDKVKDYFGDPETCPVEPNPNYAATISDETRLQNAPPLLYAPVPISKLSDASILQESTFINDFGQSFHKASPPADYRPGTIFNYTSPELFFEDRVGFESDVWSLACLIFELRTGYPLFDLSWSANDNDLGMRYAELLGPIPKKWFDAFDAESRDHWFHQDGEFRTEEDQNRIMDNFRGTFPIGRRSTIAEQLRFAGDHPLSKADEGPMCEKPHVPLEHHEALLLEDLLSRMLKYNPEDRITMAEVIKHPWFDAGSAASEARRDYNVLVTN